MNSLQRDFGAKKPPKFQDDGPPTDGKRGGAGGPPDEEMDYSPSEVGAGSGAKGPYDDLESSAADDLADLAGVAPEDRADFATALKTYVQACFSKLSAQDDGSEMPDEGEGDDTQAPDVGGSTEEG